MFSTMKKYLLFSAIILTSLQSIGQSVLITPGNQTTTNIAPDLVLRSTGTPDIRSIRSAGSLSSPTPPLTGASLLRIRGGGFWNTTSSSDQVGIDMYTTENWNGSSQGADMRFFTTPNGTISFTERMRIAHNGNIGIGTTNPSNKVHISQGLSGATSFGNTMLFLEDNVNSYISMASPESIETGILFSKPSSTVSGGMVYNSANRLQLFAGGLARLHITSSGNVGIGTSSPTAKLDIEGDIVVKKSTNTSTGTINALSRNGGSSLFMNGVGTVTVNGIAGGVDGIILYLICGNSTSLVLAHENVSAAAADRITTQTAGNVTISFRGGAVLIYEGGTQKWRIIGFAN
jgi:hypothetical protein